MKKGINKYDLVKSKSSHSLSLVECLVINLAKTIRKVTILDDSFVET